MQVCGWSQVLLSLDRAPFGPKMLMPIKKICRVPEHESWRTTAVDAHHCFGHLKHVPFTRITRLELKLCVHALQEFRTAPQPDRCAHFPQLNGHGNSAWTCQPLPPISCCASMYHHTLLHSQCFFFPVCCYDAHGGLLVVYLLCISSMFPDAQLHPLVEPSPPLLLYA